MKLDILKNLKKPLLYIFLLGTPLYLGALFINHGAPSLDMQYAHNAFELFKEGIKDFWAEAIVSVLLYFFLEEGFKKIYEIPKVEKKLKPSKILEVFIKAPKESEICILDTSLYELMPDLKSNVDTAEVNKKMYDLFKTSLTKALIKKVKIKILLLHPDTYAAYQRNKDLLKEGSDFSREIRRSLRRIHGAICEIYIKENTDLNVEEYLKIDDYLEIKLYRATSVMKLIKWHDYTSFTLLPPDVKASEAERIQTTDTSGLGGYLSNYFYKIWMSSEESSSDSLTIDFFKDFLFANLYCPDTNLSLKEEEFVCWGGSEFNLFKPKYLLIHGGMGFFTYLLQEWSKYQRGDRKDKVGLILKQGMAVKGELVYINTITTLKNSVNEPIEDPIYDNAFFRISRNYNWNKKHEENYVFYNGKVTNINYGDPIIEIRYDSEDLQVTTDRYEISEFLDKEKVGYKFLSNKQLNVNLTKGFLSTMNSFDLLFTKLPIDTYDEKFCKELNSNLAGKHKKCYVGRQRILVIYKVDVTKDKININKLETKETPKYDDKNEGKITYPVSFNYWTKPDAQGNLFYHVEKEFWKNNERSFQYNEKHFNDLEFMLSLKNENNKPLFNDLELQSIPKFLKSIVQFDLSNIIDASKNHPFKNDTSWLVYMHLIRNTVNENTISIVTPELQDNNFSYKTVHLMKKEKIKGGITQIIDNRDNLIKESYSLDTSFDSVYVNCKNKKMKVSQIEYEDVHQSEPFNHNETAIGKRDVIVLEFKKIEN